MSPLPNVAFRTYKKSSFSSFLPPIFTQVQPKTVAVQTPKQQGPEGRTKPAGTSPLPNVAVRTCKKTDSLPMKLSAKSSPKQQHYKCHNSRAVKDEPSLQAHVPTFLAFFHPFSPKSSPKR